MDATVAAKGGAPEITGSGKLSLAGTLEVTTVGTLKVGHSYGIISDSTPRGHFSKLGFPRAPFASPTRRRPSRSRSHRPDKVDVRPPL